MRQGRSGTLEIPVVETIEETLDLVVPFTTPALTAAAFNSACRLSAGLNASIRLLKIQVVPFPLDLFRTPVPVGFLQAQLRGIRCGRPAVCEVRFAREFDPGLKGALNANSLVLLATKRRPWRTRTERIAASLRCAGHTVVLVPEGNDNHA